MSETEKDFLSEDEETVEAEAPEQEETPEEAAAPEPEKVETPEPPATEVPTTPESDEVRGLKSALQAERTKRQEREAEIQRIQQYQQQQQLPSFNEAPEQYLRGVLQQHEAQVTARMLGALEAQAKEVYPDYDEMFAAVEERAADNPALIQKVMQSPNPAMAAYKLGKQLREMEAMKDPDAYRSKIEAEVRAKIEAEMASKSAARQKAVESIPPELSTARGAKADELPPPDTVFDEIF